MAVTTAPSPFSLSNAGEITLPNETALVPVFLITMPPFALTPSEAGTTDVEDTLAHPEPATSN